MNNLVAPVVMARDLVANDPDFVFDFFRKQRDKLVGYFSALHLFAASANVIEQVTDMEMSALPDELKSDPPMASLWESIRPEERYKLAVIAMLYISSAVNHNGSTLVILNRGKVI